MTRDNTLINDPNSLFAISRALRKQIVETDTNPQNRNNAIRDEKHIAYKSTGKDGYESFKYDILTNLEQLDNYFLELETVLGKITSDEDALRLEQEVRKAKKASTTPAKRGRPPKAKGAETTGAGYYRGGVLPKLPIDETLIDSLTSLVKGNSISDDFRPLLNTYITQLNAEIKKYNSKTIEKSQLLTNVNDIFNSIDTISLSGTPEENDLEEVNNVVIKYLGTLPDVAPDAEQEKSLKQRRAIPIATGNEFVVSTLSKINILLIKLIAEYNGKILVNYKKFLQSDLEEIALKVIDSQRRFRELKDYLKDYEEGTRAVNITKFLDTIDNNFKKFTALSSRSIANFVNPNIQLLPNFSQQLSETYQDPKQPFNLYQETEKQKKDNLDEKVDAVARRYITFREKYAEQQEIFNELNEEFTDYQDYLNRMYNNYNTGKISGHDKVKYERILERFKIVEPKLQSADRKLQNIRKKLQQIELMPEYAFFPRGVV
jgi:hypothetical protein